MADETDTSRPDPQVLLLVFLWLVMPLAAVPVLRDMWAGGPLPPARGQIDPNSAPWWELTLLPRIGMATAFDIIQYRETASSVAANRPDGRVFGSVADLARVRGIGPVTLRETGPYLTFGSPSPGTTRRE